MTKKKDVDRAAELFLAAMPLDMTPYFPGWPDFEYRELRRSIGETRIRAARIEQAELAGKRQAAKPHYD